MNSVLKSEIKLYVFQSQPDQSVVYFIPLLNTINFVIMFEWLLIFKTFLDIIMYNKWMLRQLS